LRIGCGQLQQLVVPSDFRAQIYGSEEIYTCVGDMPATVTPAAGFVDIPHPDGSGEVPMLLTNTLYGACPWAISLGADYNRPVPGLPNQLAGRVIGIQSIVMKGQVCGVPSSGAGRAVPCTGGVRGVSADSPPVSSLPARSVRRGRWPWRGPCGEAG
jgi:hypothetical protein